MTVDDCAESEAKYHAIFDLANDAIFMHDAATGAILEVNQRMTEMYGWSREEAGRLAVADLSADEPPFTQDRALELIAASAVAPQLFEWRAKHRSGRLFWVEVNLKRIAIGGVERLLAIVRDITDRKDVERSLRAADERLREQAALVRLGEMAAVVAHEVRNPLAGVRGAMQVIGGRLAAGSRDAAIIGEVVARLDSLDELITDLLLFARPPQPRFVAVDVVALVRDTCDLLARDARAQGVPLHVEGEAPAVMGDPRLLKSAMLNLLLNAIAAVQNAGTVRTCVTASGGTCRIAVTDTGPGIPPEVRDRIFVPFFTTKARGTGLGLPTAKRVADAHGGRITVECPAEGGTVVAIELPYGAAPELQRSSP